MSKRDIGPDSGRLESWKEIAAYFHRDLRTVIRWEKELGLPVRRYPGKAKGRVYADVAELKAWAEKRSGPVAQAPAPLPESKADEERAAGRSRIRFGVFASAAALLIVVSAVFVLGASRHSTGISSVAVLPFDNLGGASDPAFVEGLTDDISAALSRLDRVRVAGRRSAYQFAAKQSDLHSVGSALHVEAIVEGSVERIGDKVRVSVEVERVRDGATLWARTFDSSATDLLYVQSDISNALLQQFAHTDAVKSAPQTTSNPEARALYLQGRYLWNQRNLDAEQKSVAYMRRAVAADPSYAQAWSGLAESLMTIGNIESVLPAPYITEAKQAAQRALHLDPSLAEVHAVLGRIAAHYDYDWATAQQEYQKAFALDPNYATAHQYYALGLMAHGRFKEAEKQLDIAQELDPLALIVGVDRALLRKYEHDYKAVVAESQKVLQLDPNYKLGYSMLSVGYAMQGDWAKWKSNVSEAQRSRLLAAVSKSDMGQAKREFAQDEARYARGEMQAAMLATEAVAVGDRQAALDWLERSYQQHEYWTLFINVEPQLDGLHEEPRFQALVKKLGV